MRILSTVTNDGDFVCGESGVRGGEWGDYVRRILSRVLEKTVTD